MIRRVTVACLLFLLAACDSLTGEKPASPPATLPSAETPNIVAAADATREKGACADASKMYRQILLTDPSQAAAQYGLAECLLRDGNAEAAGPLFEVLIKDNTFRARALQGKGLCLLASGQRQPAGDALRQATEADASLARSWNALGTIADLERHPQQALKFYSRALTIQPKSAITINNIGYSRLLAGDADEAIVQLRNALVLEPHSETIQNNLRLALAAKGNYGEALKAVPPERMASVLNDIGYMAMRRGDYAVAEGYFARSMEASPTYNGVAAKNLDRLKAKQGASP